MNIQRSEFGQIIVITPLGSIDASTAGEVETALTEQINQGKAWLVLDMSQVEFMSSAGLRMILNGLKASRQAGGNLRIAAARPGVANVLSISGVDAVTQVYDRVDAALDSFDGTPPK